MPTAALVLLLANVVYGTSYVVTRLALGGVPPATLALARLVVASLVLWPLVGRRPLPAGQGARIFWMGAAGFSVALVLTNWGIEYSSATNAALLIIVEPLTMLALGPALLGERLSRREVAGAAAALLGAVVVVTDGVPGLTVSVFPRWRGDVLLALSGVAYALYSLIGRSVLTPETAAVVTARSIAWGAVCMLPAVAVEWAAGARPVADALPLAGVLYLGLVITAGGYVVWNWALARVEAARAAASLTVQPVVGALLGAVLLGDPVSGYTAAGGALIVTGLWMSAAGRR
jgi:drug/metabolite transporter (DMT)-like permease